MSQSSVRPLSLGNIISAGVTLYRSHLKSYFGVSLKAHLWSLVPVYGWAKFHCFSAAIARHAFGELSGQPEALEQSKTHLQPQMWLFFVVQLLVGLILFAVNIVLSIVQFLFISLPLTLILSTIPDSTIVPMIVLPLQFLIQIAFYIIYLWVWSRFFIPELPLATEENVDLVNSIGRSWTLSQGSAWRILLVISVVVVITLPIYLVALIPPLTVIFSAMPLISGTVNQPGMVQQFFLLGGLAVLVGIALFIVAGAIAMPLWQSLKASIYYDLRARREGLGLTLRDRPPAV